MALIGYARVSKKEQSLDRQVDQLKEYGVTKRNMYLEKITGTSKDRPMLKKMLSELEPDDTVLVVDITRISRSSKDLLTIIDEIKGKNASIKSIKDTWLDTTSENPYASFLLTVMSALSQLERELISSRTKEGLESSRKRGKVGGRPKINKASIEQALILYEDGRLSISDICTMSNISKNTLYNYVRKEKSKNTSSKK